jgi:flagellar hook protein FlgE
MAVGSFSAGLSGLSANAAYLGIIGNNLANINTVGFKTSAVSFQDLVSQTVSGSSINPMQVGLGVMMGSISPVFSQGSIENSTDPTNVAIQGGGFFVVKSPGGQIAYTRAGNFSFNADGALVTPDGWKVQGWSATDPATGKISTAAEPTDIIVPPGVLRPPTPTSQFGMLTNLNASAPVASTLTTAVQIYDALGQSHTLNVTYTKTSANGWDFKVDAAGAEVTGGTAMSPFTVASGSLTFDTKGALSSCTVAGTATGGGTAPAITDVKFTTPTWANGAPASALTWDIVNDQGTASLSGYSAASATSSITQNGSSASMIDNLNVSSDGTILGSGGGSQTAAVAQLALASFTNPKGLAKTGSNCYTESSSAGVPNVGVAGTGGRGSLIGSALEQSNVDIAKEFTQMILAQRGYQANSKTITVSDELLVTTLELKR